MVLRFLFIVSMVVSLGVSVDFSTQKRYSDGNIDVVVNYEDDHDYDRSEDWIAIYKKGDSTDWENVLSWARVKNLKGLAPSDQWGHFFARKNIGAGEYEVRFFKSNSYDIDQSISFTITESSSFLQNIYLGSGAIYYVELNDDFKPNENDWTAIYRVGDSNDWENVVAWNRVNDLKEKSSFYWKKSALSLPSGTYEVRYFLNNSYDLHMKSKPFTALEDNDQIAIQDTIIDYDNQRSYYIPIINASGNVKDWIAIFEKGVEKNSENILAWKYNETGLKNGTIDFDYGVVTLLPGEYDIVFFENDSYDILATANLTINNANPYFAYGFFGNSNNYNLRIKDYAYPKDKDWIAIFKQGDTHTIEHIISWKYLNKEKQFSLNKVGITGGYTIVLFSNDTYTEITKIDVTE